MRHGRPYLLRKLAREMIAERGGVSAKKVAEEAVITASSLSRLENAEGTVYWTTFRALLDAYHVEGDRRDYLTDLWQAGRAGRPYWSTFGDVLGQVPWFETYVDLELEAQEVTTFDPWLLNGLVQTEGYATALVRAANPALDDVEVERIVGLRTARQERVVNGQLGLVSVICEEVLARPYGGEQAFRQQLGQLREMMRLPRVTVQVLPAGGTPPPHAGMFHVVDFTDPVDPAVAYTETLHDALYVWDEGRVREYARTHRELRGVAHNPEDSAEIIAQRMKG
jgi:transcriptional regulator with XRE-family HTH domain